MIDILVKYYSLGLKCLPTKQDKSPNISTTWKDGIEDTELYKNTFGIGIICGKLSGGLECLDFDNHFEDAKDNLSKFIAEIKDIYNKYHFPIESTMNGGYHLIYRCSKIEGNQKLAQRPKKDEKSQKFRPDTIIETRGEGGYFVASPTPGYKWVRNTVDNIPVISIEDRNTIIEVAKTFNTWFELRKNEYENNNKPGDIFNESTESKSELISCLIGAGWTDLGNGNWQRPNKKVGISATLDKVANNVFYVFSSNAYPFEPSHAYTPFQVLALLKYKGDFKEFARELAEKYNINKPQKRDRSKPETKVYSENQLEDIMNKSYIDLSIPISRPPTIIKIRDFENGSLNEKRLFTLQNFSAITGKSKSKKSFLGTLFMAAATCNGLLYNKICGYLPLNKPGVILFDTEQSNYDTYKYGKNVMNLIGGNFENFGTWGLREYSPKERCEIIDFILTKYKDNISYVVIDGIADLVNAINDEDEATRVSSLLMKWTKLFNIHITVNIHQNKNDNYATGWIGSYILKKAECIISVTKDQHRPFVSLVECMDIRGTSEFNPFEIEINEQGLPVINENLTLSNHYEVKEIDF